MGRHVDDMPTVILRNPRAKGKPAPAPTANGPSAVAARQRPSRTPRTPRTDRGRDRDRARKVDNVEGQTPNANLVFIRNVPQYIAKTAVPGMLNAYNPVYVKRIHPEGKTTTVVSGYTSRATAEQVQEHMNNLRLLDTVLQVELYQDERSVQFLKGNPRALKKANIGHADEDQDEEDDDDYAYEEERLVLGPPLPTSLDFPALPTMQLRGGDRNDDASPAKEWVTIRPTPPPVETTSGMRILRKTPVATPTFRLPLRDDDALSGVTVVDESPLRTSTSTPILNLHSNSVSIHRFTDGGQVEHTTAEGHPALPLHYPQESTPHLVRTPPGLESRRRDTSLEDLVTRLSAVVPRVRTPPPAREPLFAPLEHLGTTSRIVHHHRHNCTFCGWLRDRRLRRAPQAKSIFTAQDIDSLVRNVEGTAGQEHQSHSRPTQASAQTHWRGLSESQIAARMEHQRNVI